MKDKFDLTRQKIYNKTKSVENNLVKVYILWKLIKMHIRMVPYNTCGSMSSSTFEKKLLIKKKNSKFWVWSCTQKFSKLTVISWIKCVSTSYYKHLHLFGIWYLACYLVTLVQSYRIFCKIWFLEYFCKIITKSFDF